MQCNEKAVEILQAKSKDNLLTLHFSDISPEFQPDGELSHKKAEAMMQLSIDNEEHQFEWVFKRANSEAFWAEVNLTPIVLNNHKVIYRAL